MSSSLRVASPAFQACRSQATLKAIRPATRSSAISSSYAATFDLPVQLDSPVHSLSPAAGGFLLELGRRSFKADQVVVATGPFQVPRASAGRGPRSGRLPDAQHGLQEAERRPRRNRDRRRRRQHRIPDRQGTVGHARVHLAIGSRQTPLPQRLLGRDLFWWLTKRGSSRRLSIRGSDSGAGARHADRIQPEERRASRRGAQAARDSVPRAALSASRTAAHSRSTLSSGRRVPLRLFLDRRSCLRFRRPRHASAWGNGRSQVSTSWACRGSTRAAQRSSVGSRAMPSSSPNRSRRHRGRTIRRRDEPQNTRHLARTAGD